MQSSILSGGPEYQRGAKPPADRSVMSDAVGIRPAAPPEAADAYSTEEGMMAAGDLEEKGNNDVNDDIKEATAVDSVKVDPPVNSQHTKNVSSVGSNYSTITAVDKAPPPIPQRAAAEPEHSTRTDSLKTGRVTGSSDGNGRLETEQVDTNPVEAADKPVKSGCKCSVS